MKTGLLIGAATLLAITAPARAAPADDAASAVAAILDKFNAGDSAAFIAAHTADAVIVDEFAPFIWTGEKTAERWIADYGRDASARGIKGGRVDHGRPLQATAEGSSAYVVLPTTYRFVQKGLKMAGTGSMTFVMTKVGTAWKIASWTYSGATPAPAR